MQGKHVICIRVRTGQLLMRPLPLPIGPSRFRHSFGENIKMKVKPPERDAGDAAIRLVRL